MAKKELTQREMYLASLIPEITSTSDPLGSRIDRVVSEANELQAQIHNTQKKLNALVKVNEPVAPEPTTKTTAGVTFGITGAVVVILFIFHCIIWLLKHLFSISLDTWGWTVDALIYGVAISVICTCIAAYYDKKKNEAYEENVDSYNDYVKKNNQLTTRLSTQNNQMIKLEKVLGPLCRDRYDALAYAINSELGLPCPFSAIDGDSYLGFKKEYLNLLSKQQHISQIADKGERMKAMRVLMDEKLEFLYKRSIKAEVSSEVYNEFGAQVGRRRSDGMALRRDLPAARSRGIAEIQSLPEYKQLLNDDTLTPIIHKFEAVTNRDTHKSGFFSFMPDPNKKTEQTKDMQRLAKAAKNEYDELMDINAKVSYALDFVRACAYRNLYLGGELLNYVRSTHAGGSLTKEQDGIDMSAVSSDGLQMDLTDLDVGVTDSALNTLAVMGNAVMDNKGLQQLVKDNPKVSLGIAAVATIGSAAVSYFSNLSNNADAQKQMIDAVKAISEGYTEGKANMFRAIEIIGAIVKCNDGFMAIYEPLRKKVFDDGDFNLTRDEQTKFALALKEYKRVSETKMKTETKKK